MRPTWSGGRQLLLSLGKDQQARVFNWGLGELSFTGLVQAFQTCNSRHPHVEALRPVVGDEAACCQGVSPGSGREGGGHGNSTPLHRRQQPLPSTRWGLSTKCGSRLVPAAWEQEKLPIPKPSPYIRAPHAASTTQPTPQTTSTGKAGRQQSSGEVAFLPRKEASPQSVPPRNGENTSREGPGSLRFAGPFPRVRWFPTTGGHLPHLAFTMQTLLRRTFLCNCA